MALVTTTKTINGNEYLHNYSDAGYMIKQDETDILFSDALDPINSDRTYTETDIMIEDEQTRDDEYTLIGKILFGEED